MFSKFLRYSRILCQISEISRMQFKRGKFNVLPTPVGIIGVPLNKGQGKFGVEKGPDVLRNYGFVKQLQDLGLDVKDYGNVNLDFNIEDFDIKERNLIDTEMRRHPGKLIYSHEVGAACYKISNAVQKVLLENRKCVTLGGDHSLGMGTIHGHAQVHDTCVLWVDAHADINTSLTTLSGYLHGMPLSFLIKELKKYQGATQGFEWLKPCISKNNLAFIGLRDVDPLEKLILTKENICYFSMREIDKFGIFEVINRALETINPTGKLSLHVSFDIDSVCRTVIPCTGTPVLGGLTIREALCIAEEICHLDSFRALDLVEVNPDLGNKEQLESTLGISTLIAKAFLGCSRHGNAPSDVLEIPVS